MTYDDLSTRKRVAMTGNQYLTAKGKIFYAEVYESALAASASIVFLIETPVSAKVVKGFFIAEADSGILVELYENTSASGGTNISPINMNRNSSNSCDTVAVESPTVSDYGTKLVTEITGSSGTWFSGGNPGFTESKPIVFKLNTKYAIKVTNTGASSCKVKVGVFFTEEDV